jgi:hypothetical protein
MSFVVRTITANADQDVASVFSVQRPADRQEVFELRRA